MSDPVFMYDSFQELVKIVMKPSGLYHVFRLWKVEEHRDGTYEFSWERKPCRVHPFKPYEDADVSDDPADYIEDVERWHRHKIVNVWL